MGYFSKLCSKTNLPVLAERRDGELLRLSTVVVLTPCGDQFDHVYQGYGIPGVDWDTVKLVLKDAYLGEAYDDLPLAPSDGRQGFFQSAELAQLLARSPSLPSPEAYDELCLQEDKAFEAAWEKAARELGIVLDQEVEPYRLAAMFSMVLDGVENGAVSRYNYQAGLKRFPCLAKQLPSSLEASRKAALQFEEIVHREVAQQLQEAARAYLSNQEVPA